MQTATATHRDGSATGESLDPTQVRGFVWAERSYLVAFIAFVWELVALARAELGPHLWVASAVMAAGAVVGTMLEVKSLHAV